MIYELHFVDGVTMVDRDGSSGRSRIEAEFERLALAEQAVRALLLLLVVNGKERTLQ